MEQIWLFSHLARVLLMIGREKKASIINKRGLQNLKIGDSK
jgi:hypothetical protein